MKEKILEQSINRNDRFWVDTVDFLSSSLHTEGVPSFVSSWIKEVLNRLESLSIILVMPVDGCWGIYVKNKEDYLFSYNDGQTNIYISKRLYEYFKKKNEYKLLAGVLLREITEFIMCQKAKKKGRMPDLKKIRGEAGRVGKAFMGKGRQIENVLEHLAELEKERRKVTVDSHDVFVEGCAVSGEEIVAEISSILDTGESFIVELAPGEKKKISYSAGTFLAVVKQFNMPFVLDGIDFKDYCRFMKIMDNFFIEESILEGPFRELLVYIRNLNYFEEYDNFLLKLLCVFVQQLPKREILYNLYLLIDKYVTYFALLEEVKTKYWKHGRYVKDYLDKIVNEVYAKKEVVLEGKRENTARMKNWLMSWFSRMDEFPDWFTGEKTPQKFSKLYKSPMRTKDELSMHKYILQIMSKISALKTSFRHYNGVKRHAGSKICELQMIRTHFWNGKSLFNKGERIGIYTQKKNGAGIVEVLDIKGNSIIVSLATYDSTIPETGFLKKFEEVDESISAQLEAIDNIRGIAEKVLKMCEAVPESKEGSLKEISFFNQLINEDNSQKEAVLTALNRDMIILIQGPPGTGKTTVIAEIVLQYLKEGKRVLLSSQTHNAVDNALENIMRYKTPEMGIGRVASKEEKILDRKIKNIWIKGERELDLFELKHKQGMVIGATNVGTHTLSLMKEREFDVLVMDEAGKSNIIESILPMLLLGSSGKLIIVGDHMQGRPFGYDDRILELLGIKEKLNQSLFERLLEKGCLSIMLRVNYRSEPQIVDLVSKLFYNGMLIPAKSRPFYEKGGSRKAKSIVIVDTSKLASIEKRKETEVGEGRGYINTFEAMLVLKEAKELLKYRYISTGIRSRYLTGVTILAPYVFQVEEIKKVLHKADVTTIDSFQGRENDVIIISFTRSNINPAEVGFLNELNRINVALSRARRKMILIGDFNTLQNTKKGPKAGATRKIFRTIYNFR